MSTFVRNPLLKSASELEKMKKKSIFFNFLKMILDSIYDHWGVSDGFATSQTPFPVIPDHFEAI